MALITPTVVTHQPRHRILIAAHELFYREGVRATGIDRVISQAQVTKVTFYRQFSSKEALIIAYLEYRHERWMAWFRGELAKQIQSNKTPLEAIVNTLRSWWVAPDFRGCAFINSAVELGTVTPQVLHIFRRHKADMQATLLPLLPASQQASDTASHSIALAIDGSIVQVQAGVSVDAVCLAFRNLIGHIWQS